MKIVIERMGDLKREYDPATNVTVIERLPRRVVKKPNGTSKYVNREFSEPLTKTINELKISDYIGISLAYKEIPYDYNGYMMPVNDTKKEYQNTIPIDNPKFWWLVGRFLGDGWVRCSPKPKGIKSKFSVIVCCGKHESDILDNFFINFKIPYCRTEERTAFKYTISRQEWCMFFKQFGQGAANKHIPEQVKQLPIHLLKEVIDGYMSADGCYVINTSYNKMETVSKLLALDILECIEKVYKIPVTIYFVPRDPTCVIEGRTVNQKDSYQIKFRYNTPPTSHAFIKYNYIWYPIRNISTI